MRKARQRPKKAGFLLKLLVVMLAVYAAVQMVVLQIEINTQRDRQEQWSGQRDALSQSNAALRSFNASVGSAPDDETIAQIAHDLGWVWRDEIIIVDKGR